MTIFFEKFIKQSFKLDVKSKWNNANNVYNLVNIKYTDLILMQ